MLNHQRKTLTLSYPGRLVLQPQRNRFIIKAIQPAIKPPPTIVIANVRKGLPLWAWVPGYNKSRTPPCTMSTDKVRRHPMLNHQRKTLTLSYPLSV